MQTTTDEIRDSMASSSWIRRMFEKGLELKRQFGEDAVCDFSLGNPDVPPPGTVRDALESIAVAATKPLGLGYCPNAGIPAVREAMAKYLSRQQQTDLQPQHVVMSVGAAGAMVSSSARSSSLATKWSCPRRTSSSTAPTAAISAAS